MSGGYILLHRSVFTHHVFNDAPFTEREAWVWLLAQASYQPNKMRYKSEMIEVARGEVPTSYRKLKEVWGWGTDRIRRFLILLENERMIARRTGTGFLVITICNYDKFQGQLIKSGTQPGTATGTQAGTQPGTNINKRIKDKENNTYTAEFELFWTAYPLKKAKADAAKAFMKAANKVTLDEILKGVVAYCGEINTKGTKPEHIAHAATWLNGSRWSDEYITSKPPPSVKHPARETITRENLHEYTGHAKHA